jgi:hypothetical protein
VEEPCEWSFSCCPLAHHGQRKEEEEEEEEKTLVAVVRAPSIFNPRFISGEKDRLVVGWWEVNKVIKERWHGVVAFTDFPSYTQHCSLYFPRSLSLSPLVINRPTPA